MKSACSSAETSRQLKLKLPSLFSNDEGLLGGRVRPPVFVVVHQSGGSPGYSVREKRENLLQRHFSRLSRKIFGRPGCAKAWPCRDRCRFPSGHLRQAEEAAIEWAIGVDPQ